MADGIGCTCFAYYQGECACDADWTPSEVYELQAHINELREALEIASATLIKYEIDCGEYTTKEHENTVKKLKQAIAQTPAQSLAAHDNEVIERCAKILEDFCECEFGSDQIRALKKEVECNG